MAHIQDVSDSTPFPVLSKNTVFRRKIKKAFSLIQSTQIGLSLLTSLAGHPVKIIPINAQEYYGNFSIFTDEIGVDSTASTPQMALALFHELLRALEKKNGAFDYEIDASWSMTPKNIFWAFQLTEVSVYADELELKRQINALFIRSDSPKPFDDPSTLTYEDFFNRLSMSKKSASLLLRSAQIRATLEREFPKDPLVRWLDKNAFETLAYFLHHCPEKIESASLKSDACFESIVQFYTDRYAPFLTRDHIERFKLPNNFNDVLHTIGFAKPVKIKRHQSTKHLTAGRGKEK